MLTIKEYKSKLEGMTRKQLNCDSCSDFIGFFIKYPDNSHSFQKIKKEMMIMHMSDGVFVFCSIECMNTWVKEHHSLIEMSLNKNNVSEPDVINNIDEDDEYI